MNTYTKKSEPTFSSVNTSNNTSTSSFLIDERPEALQARELQQLADNSPQAGQAAQLQAMADDYTSQLHRREEQDTMPASSSSGLPQNIINGAREHLNVDISNTKVKFNSSEPAQLGAHAIAKGNSIELGPGQEQYLGHEAVHVAQQLKGQVKPTTQVNGVDINDDPALEKEADDIGAKIGKM